ncbi:MAG: Gfo/Idh/MocA family oxidoreductase [Leptonema illini]|uniref:Gfo/Idh/MocA family oxidoreductase n=1 Tax=Leptonema illini TaxID=183 RepID=A0A833H323_9LEPT|nr:MAG: Gfo/Idh/MocA family oxidoreductase [Leptonema illini]PKN15928.1 MAG: gfo/Idh/MocA family oxidoreductase [Deltaproteobacteria bacterium HGW-Deltaproteobacteria-23]
MKVLVIGLGSMGTRRIRNLQALEIQTIAGFDIREDRRSAAAARYGITVYSDWIDALEDYRPDALVISTSPEHHMTYAWPAAERNTPCFIEASVVDADRILALHKRIEGTTLVMAPSCTMRFYPGPMKVKELLQANTIGRVLNVNYQTGQYLPDWHPWERIEDYYVSKRETGGGREIVPFELTWLNDIFGQPEPLACVKGTLSDIPADIDDVYHCILRYPGNVILNMTVEVISRPHATRELRVLGSEGEIVFSADENCVRFASSESPDWKRFDLGKGTVEKGYINPEEPYIIEMRCFLEAVRKSDQSLFPNSLYDDYLVLRALQQLEKISGA